MFSNPRSETPRHPAPRRFATRPLLFAALLSVAGCAAVEPAAPAKAVPSDPAAALAGIVAAVPPGKTLAFTGLSGPGGATSGLAGTAALKLEPLLVGACRDKGVTLIEREKLLLILEEWKLEMSGLTRGDQGARELLGADVILTGSVQAAPPLVHVYLKAINLRDGAVLAAARIRQPAEDYGALAFAETTSAAPATHMAPSAGGARNRGTSPDGRVSLWTEKDSYAVGEKLTVFFEVTEAAHVTLVDLTPDGNKTVIFPNAFQADSYCRPGAVYRVPPPGAAFSLEVTEPAGRDRLMAMTSDRPGLDPGLVRTRGLKFTTDIVGATTSRASIAFDIR